MKKKLYFYIWVSPDFEQNIAVLTHKICLKRYIGVFDEVNFVVATDDYPSIDGDLLKGISFIKDVCGDMEYNLMIVKNDKHFGELESFRELILPLISKDKDEMVFHGHVKGVNDVTIPYRNVNSVLRWIISMYYYSLEYTEEAENKLIDGAMYGSLLTKFPKRDGNLKYHDKLYIGSFYWFNPKNVKKYMVGNIDELADRFCVENLSQIVDEHKLFSHNDLITENTIADLYNLKKEQWQTYLSYYGDSGALYEIQNDIIASAYRNAGIILPNTEDNLDIFVISHKNFETERVNPIYKIVCSENDDVVSDKLKVIKVPATLANDGWSEWQKIFEIFRGNAGKLKEYVGICHYHRYLNFGNDVNYVPNMNELFKDADVCVCNRVHVTGGLRQQYGACHCIEDYDICGEVIKDLYPDMYNTFVGESYFGKSMLAGNIIILKRDDFINLCNFMFDVLFEYCERVGIDDTSNESFHEHVKNNMDKYSKKHYIDDVNFEQQSRIPAFLSERLLTVWVMYTFKRIRLFEMIEN